MGGLPDIFIIPDGPERLSFPQNNLPVASLITFDLPSAAEIHPLTREEGETSASVWKAEAKFELLPITSNSLSTSESKIHLRIQPVEGSRSLVQSSRLCVWTQARLRGILISPTRPARFNGVGLTFSFHLGTPQELAAQFSASATEEHVQIHRELVVTSRNYPTIWVSSLHQQVLQLRRQQNDQLGVNWAPVGRQSKYCLQLDLNRMDCLHPGSEIDFEI
ncbi:hypothetical protein C8R43DRAFT_1193306 [Mycena crocata]|nr:hypothetical protein C8R43DRAFT_1193306 [Mycena crocata]